MTITHAAAAGFETDADRYARGRPDYPAEVASWLRDTLHLGPGKTVIDLGAGTGKFTKRLIETGADVIAVEPAAAMRAKLTEIAGLKVLEGTAEAIPLTDASVDAIVCAQAFHWFATKAALAEIARVLKPGSVLGLIWNTHDTGVTWVNALSEVTSAYEGDAPRFRSGKWRDAFPAPGFAPLEEASFANAQTGPAEQIVVDRMLSTSFIATLPSSERQIVADKLRAIIAGEPELADRDEITIPYRTFAYSATRL
ncbi:MAG: class I SAM-dependent methyltransferase [Devosia sp.]